jgi:nucleoside 2-deoxyribosyltransferase
MTNSQLNTTGVAVSNPINLVYLAGPITGCSYDGATDWRAEAASQFSDWIKPISPLRNKQYLKGSESIAADYPNYALSTAKAISSRDRNDVWRSDLILVNFLGAIKVSIGTVIEIAWATEFKKPIVLVMEDDNVHNHPMLVEGCGFRVKTIQEGVQIAERILSVGV